MIMKRKITMTHGFEREAKRLLKQHRLTRQELKEAIDAVASKDERAMPARYRDHALTGDWRGFRELHVHDDVLVIYEMPDGTVFFVHIGTHDLFFKNKRH